MRQAAQALIQALCPRCVKSTVLSSKGIRTQWLQ